MHFFAYLGVLVLIVLCTHGWGYMLLRAPILKRHTWPFFIRLWTGFVLLIGILQFLHIFWPIQFSSIFPIFLIGIFASAYSFLIPLFESEETFSTNLLTRISKKSVFRTFTVLAATSLIGLWLIARAMASPLAYDAGLYYLQAIKWNQSYAIVPGLGNLIGQFAFNSTQFLLAAALGLESGRFLLLNIFVFISSFWTAMSLLESNSKEESAYQPLLAREKPMLPQLSALFVLPFFAYLAASPMFMEALASAAPDASVSLLQIVIFLLLARILGEESRSKIAEIYLFVLTILVSALVTIKLSALVYAIVSLLIAFLSHRRRLIADLSLRNPLFIAFLIVFFIGSIWLLRGFLLSGMPIYPSTLFFIDFEWAVPKESAIIIQKWIFSWARQPGVNWEIVLANWDWFKPWLLRFVTGNLLDAVYPLFVATVCISLVWILGMAHFIHLKPSIPWKALLRVSGLLLPPLAGLVFWFFTAPDPRFALPLFYLFASGAAILLLHALWGLFRSTRWRFAGILVLFVFNSLGPVLLIYIHRKGLYHRLATKRQDVPKPKIKKSKLPSNTPIYSVLEGDQCWDAPLPCMPRLNPSLRLRIPGKLDSGFRIAREEKTLQGTL